MLDQWRIIRGYELKGERAERKKAAIRRARDIASWRETRLQSKIWEADGAFEQAQAAAAEALAAEQALRTVISEWQAAFGKKPATAKKLITTARALAKEGDKALAKALAPFVVRAGAANPRALGWALLKSPHLFVRLPGGPPARWLPRADPQESPAVAAARWRANAAKQVLAAANKALAEHTAAAATNELRILKKKRTNKRRRLPPRPFVPLPPAPPPLLAAWRGHFGTEPVTAGEVVRRAVALDIQGDGSLLATLPCVLGERQRRSQALIWFLRKHPLHFTRAEGKGRAPRWLPAY